MQYLHRYRFTFSMRSHSLKGNHPHNRGGDGERRSSLIRLGVDPPPGGSTTARSMVVNPGGTGHCLLLNIVTHAPAPLERGWGSGSVGDRGGGKPPPCGPPPLLAVAHSHHGPVHGEISEKPRTRRPTGSTPDTAALLIYARARTPPGAGRGRSAEGAGGVGVAGEGRMSASAGRGAGKGCRREVRWLECGRQGRGNKFPLPVSLSPSGDIHHGPVHGEILEKSRARLLP